MDEETESRTQKTIMCSKNQTYLLDVSYMYEVTRGQLMRER